ncbi:hypothetical protein ABEB36_002198 [Hypothenemus hampei]|uniref:Venom serine protease 34 n=1 Tax=Hypothenemus hampei TaxID=57062 RepID=A0ABD1F4W5_HYPHA
MPAGANFLNFFIPMTAFVNTIDPRCNFYQEMAPEEIFYIFNMEYPGNYSSGISCQWIAKGPPRSKILLSCQDVVMPKPKFLPTCLHDRLEVSSSGKKDLSELHNYCGEGSFSLLTQESTLKVALKTSSWSPGGRFLCSITAILNPHKETGAFPSPMVESNCQCGWKNDIRIVGGQETMVNEYPFMAGLIDQNGRIFCGGTIISPHYLVTAAHCVDMKIPSDLFVLVGDHDITTGNDTSSSAVYRVKNIKIFEGYNKMNYEGDIAMLYTDRITFSDNVGPICLPFRYILHTFQDQQVTVLGWGSFEFSGPSSNTLQQVKLNVISNEECENDVEEMIIFSEICTFTPEKDSCQFDSGGPLLWQNQTNKKLFLIGIISHGLGCAGNSPGINTRITSFLDWIVRFASTETFCLV